jgi:hypothetical protein
MNAKRQFEFHILLANWRVWLPSRGNVLFTLLMMAGLLYAIRSGVVVSAGRPATPTSSTDTIAYQGRLADADGNPLTGTYGMMFNLYNVASGGSPLWTELWTGVDGVEVVGGLFNVLLGSMTPIPQNIIENNQALWLGIKVGTDNEMMPRVQLASVPFAVQAQTVLQSTILRGFTPTVFSDQITPETPEGLHRWPSSGQSQANIAFKVPDDYVSGDLAVRMMFREHDTAPGTVVKFTQTILRYFRLGGGYTVIPGGPADHTFGPGFRAFTIPSGNFEAGDFIVIQEVRDGDHVDDTAGRLDLMAIGVEYIGRGR